MEMIGEPLLMRDSTFGLQTAEYYQKWTPYWDILLSCAQIVSKTAYRCQYGTRTVCSSSFGHQYVFTLYSQSDSINRLITFSIDLLWTFFTNISKHKLWIKIQVKTQYNWGLLYMNKGKIIVCVMMGLFPSLSFP